MKTRLIGGSSSCALALAQPAVAQDAKLAVRAKPAAIKESEARNQAAPGQDSQTEHTGILLKGEGRKSPDKIRHYGPHGKVRKTPIGMPPPRKEMRGLQERVMQNKAAGLTENMDRAVALTYNSIPPSPRMMQPVSDAGGVPLGQADPGMVEFQFRNGLKPGDALSFSFESATKASGKIAVNSYLYDRKDAITLGFQNLPDRTNYVASPVLQAQAKSVEVRISDANYKTVG